MGNQSIPIDDSIYNLFERARLLCTRGVGELLNNIEIEKAKQELSKIENWMNEILSMLPE